MNEFLHQPAFWRTFPSDRLLQIAMPMGGIGAGCICLSGNGALQDFSIHNKPATTALADGHDNVDTAFAVLHVNSGKPITLLLEGPIPVEKIYDQGLQAQGYRKGGHEGLPRFRQCSFEAGYPFGRVTLADADVPLEVRITGWSPFIPLDDKNSGIPCSILEYELINRANETIQFDFSYHMSHWATGGDWKLTRNAIIQGAGVNLYNVANPDTEAFGSCSLSVVGHAPRIKAMWMRGGWFDWLNGLWAELCAGDFRANDGNAGHALGGRNGASILMPGKLEPGQRTTYPILLTWYFPNVHLAACGIPRDTSQAHWQPYYAGQWQDAADVSAYVRYHFTSLRSRTLAFQQALSSSTLPPEVIDAVSSNLAILKSPTVLRQKNGHLWGWEGCFTNGGCCPGSCTHVWNYAQALPHLFPQLERTLREMEYQRSMDERGHVQFRAALPDGPTPHDFHAAADGQLGGLMKLYRDWQISGDNDWLASLYPLARRSLEYCIRTWDPDEQGALFEPHHNTYDIEFWGPDGMCTSVYLGALLAAAAMAQHLGKTEDSRRYQQIAQRGKAYADAELFNGEYFQQKVMWKELRDPSFAHQLARPDLDPEERRLLEREGPKYQYGSGCLADGVIGAWMARIYGLDYPLSQSKVRSTLKAIFQHCFKPILSRHACMQRPGYAIGDEPGLLLCTWPRGGRPTVPFVYSDEVWTGIEYQVASHLIEEGLVDEGLAIVRAARSRYDGRVRNPFNEYECGSYYARAMASFALLNSLSGFRYSAVSQTLGLSPKLNVKPWKSFFSAASGFGMIHLNELTVSIHMLEGELPLQKIVLTLGESRHEQSVEGAATVSRPLKIDLK